MINVRFYYTVTETHHRK